MSDPVVDFIEADYNRWIFPLRTPLIYANTDPTALREHIYNNIFNSQQPDGFVAGHLAFSRKDEYHLRRVFVLDPISTFYIYDFVYKYRSKFKKPADNIRQSFGHAFQNGTPVDAYRDYHTFRRRKYELIKQYGHFAYVDIFNCFNSFYHHEVTTFMRTTTTEESGSEFGQFLRELNAGDSIACFPQGLYPAKVMGNAYLSFIENSRKLKSPSLLRFLDDIVVAGKSYSDVCDHLMELQYLLDKHHLALNDSKTIVGDRETSHGEKHLDEIKMSLLQKRESAMLLYDDFDDNDDDDNDRDNIEVPTLNAEEREYLTSLVQSRNVAQEDVELALTLMQNERDAINLLLDPVLDRAPHLLKGLYRLIKNS